MTESLIVGIDPGRYGHGVVVLERFDLLPGGRVDPHGSRQIGRRGRSANEALGMPAAAPAGRSDSIGRNPKHYQRARPVGPVMVRS